MFSIFQSRPINYVAFLLAGIDRVTNQEIEIIYVGGNVTHIAIVLGLHNQIALLIPWCGHDFIDIDHRLNSRLVRRE